MMRSGKLDRSIIVRRKKEGISDSGTVTEHWPQIATMRAELLQSKANEEVTGYGERDAGSVIFRIRFTPDIQLADHIEFEGIRYDLNEIVEIGRRRGLELHATRIPA